MTTVHFHILSDTEKNILRTIPETRYIATNIWLDTPDSGAIFADFFTVLMALVDKGFVKEWTTEYSGLGRLPHGQREFFISQQGLRWRDRTLKQERKRA